MGIRWWSARAAAVVVVTACVVTGCGSNDPSAGPSSAAPGQLRVASLGQGDVDTLLALGIVPIMTPPWQPEAQGDPVGPWARHLEQGRTPPTALDGTRTELTDAAAEQVTQARPDVIVAVNTAFSDATYERLSRIAKVVRRPAGFANWAIPWQDQVRAIAGGLGLATQGEQLISRTDATIARTRAENPGFHARSALAVMPRPDGGSVAVFSPTDGRGQILGMLGFTVPAWVAEQAGTGFSTGVSAENYARIDVDALVYLDVGVALADQPAFRALAVSRENRVVVADRTLGVAMAKPNPVTIEWTLGQLAPRLPKFG